LEANLFPFFNDVLPEVVTDYVAEIKKGEIEN
jgi:hypothetical protein